MLALILTVNPALSYGQRLMQKASVNEEFTRTLVISDDVKNMVSAQAKIEEDSLNFVRSQGNFWNAYNAVITNYTLAPEYSLTPEKTFQTIAIEHNKVVRLLQRDPALPKEEKKSDWAAVGEFCLVIASMFAIARGARPLTTEVGPAVDNFFSGGRLMGQTVSNKAIFASFLVEMGIITAGQIGLLDVYKKFVNKYVNYKKLADKNLVKDENAAYYVEVLKNLNDGQKDDSCPVLNEGVYANLKTAQVWTDRELQRNALIMLYGLRYLERFLQQDQDSYKYDLARAEYFQLIIPFDYTTSAGIHTTHENGRLFTAEDRTSMIKDLQQMAKFKDTQATVIEM